MKKRKQNKLMTGNQRRRAARRRHSLETLEPRMMLTTLFGGETFQYMDPRGELTTVTLTGNSIVELVGASTSVSVTPTGANIAVDPSTGDVTGNPLVLNDIPGLITSSNEGRSNVEIDGGVGGTDGVENVGAINPITNPLDPNAPTQTGAYVGSGGGLVQGLLNIQAFAERPQDDLTTAYGFNFVTYTETINSVSYTYYDYELIKLNISKGPGTPTATGTVGQSITGTVLDDLNLPETPESSVSSTGVITTTYFPVTAITASAFLPETNTLYFVTETPVTITSTVNGVSTTTNSDVFNLDSVDVSTGHLTVGNLPSSITSGATALTGITFRPTSTAGSYDMLLYLEKVITPVGGTTGVLTGLIGSISGFTASGPGSSAGSQIPVETISFASSTPAVVLITGIKGITFAGVETPAGASNQMIYASTTGADAELLAIDWETGLTQDLGPLPDPKDTPDPELSPTPTPTPVIDRWGANLGDITWDADVTNPFTGGTGVLMGVDSFTGNVIMIDARYRPAASDIFSVYDVQSDYAAAMNISNAGTSISTTFEGIPITSPAGTGGVLIGALSFSGDLPTTADVLSQDIGMRAADTDELPNDDTNNITSGVDVTSQYTTLLQPTNPNDVDIVVTLTYSTADVGDRVRVEITSSDGLDHTETVSKLPAAVPPATTPAPYVFAPYVYDESNSSVTYQVTITSDTLNATDLTATLAVTAANGITTYELGSNLDIIGGLAVGQFGSIAVVDTDNNGANGNPISFSSPDDQVALVNAVNGNASTPVNVTYNGANLHNIEGLAYGVAGDFTTATSASDELLYAVYTVSTFNPATGALTPEVLFGALDTTTGDFTEITDLTTVSGLGPNIGVDAIAFGLAPSSDNSSNQQLYLLATPNTDSASTTQTLYELTYTADPITGQITAITAAVNAVPVTTISDSKNVGASVRSITFDAANNLVAIDNDTQSLVTINTSTGVTSPYSTDPVPDGTMGDAVGGIAYDYQNDRLLDVNNGPGETVGTHQIVTATTLPGVLPEVPATATSPTATPSAILMIVEDAPQAQSIGTLYIAGTVLGHVSVSGSVDYAYIGFIATGQLNASGGVPGDPNNFYIGGDLRSLTTASDIGLYSGVDIDVVGKVGTITTPGNFDAYLTIGDQVTSQTLPDSIAITPETTTQSSLTDPQILGTLSDGVPGDPNVILVDGLVGTGVTQVFGVALMAGQTITVQLETTTLPSTLDPYPTPIPVAVVDPDGRLFTSDLSKSFSSAEYGVDIGQPFTFTTQLAGVYKFEVGSFDTADVSLSGGGNYILSILGAGDLALGGLIVGGDMTEAFSPPTTGVPSSIPSSVFTIQSGDLGAVLVSGAITFTETSMGFVAYNVGDFVVDDGNLRDIEAASIGSDQGQAGGGLNFYVSGGSVGQIYSAGNLTIDAMGTDRFGDIIGSTVTGNIQMIDGASGDVWLDVAADGSIGTIRAASMTGDIADPTITGTYYADPSVIKVNADDSSTPGVIDLIQDTGDFGSPFAGGPEITTGPNGDVRYITVGGNIYQDHYFVASDGVSPPQVYPAGKSVTIQDDSGARITLTPVGPVTSTTTNGVTTSTGPALTIRTYGIEGSGGSVIVDATVAGGGGLSVKSTGTIGQPAEISQINLSDSGNVPTFDPMTGAPKLVTGAMAVTPVSLVVSGSTTNPLDIFSVIGAAIDSISNATGGEILNVTASSIGTITALGSIGVSTKSHTGEVVEMGTDLYDTYPFSHLRDGIVAGDIGFVTAGGSIGNIVATGQLGTVTPDNKTSNPTTYGITGPIFSAGEIYLINIGGGIAPSGNGGMSAAGIYSDGLINSVVGKGVGHDILGDVVSTTQIGKITLTGGVINGVDIGVISDLSQTISYDSYDTTGFGIVDANSMSTAKTPGTGSITSISLTGIGGMLNDYILADQIFGITVKQGFGILGVEFTTGTDGLIGNVTADGFGLIDDQFYGGLTVGNLDASQRDKTTSSKTSTTTALLTVSQYSPTVRQSEFNPANANTVDDLATFLVDVIGFTAPASGLDNTAGAAGQIDYVYASAGQNGGTISGFSLLSSTFHFTNAVTAIKIDTTIDNLGLTTGTLGTFLSGSTKADGSVYDDQLDDNGNPLRNEIIVAGPITSFKVYGDVIDTDIIINFNGALGQFSILASPTAHGDFLGSTLATIGTITSIAIAGQSSSYTDTYTTYNGEGQPVQATLTTNSSITALSIKTFKITTLDSTTVTLTQGVNGAGKGVTAALASATIGTMSNSSINSAGNITTITLGVMTDSTIFAGVDTTQAPLGTAPTSNSDFDAVATIATLTITGLTGQSVAFEDSFIAASILGTITLTEVPTDGSATGAVVGHMLSKSYTRKAGSATLVTVKGPLTGPDTLDQVNGFMAVLV